MKIKNNTSFLNAERLYNYGITFGVEFLIMAISVVLFKLIYINFHELGFSEYSINKRLISFLMPLLMMGLGVSLPKFLSVETKEKQLEIHYTAMVVVTLLFLLSLLITVLFSSYFSGIVFGDPDHEKMLFACLFFVYSLMIHACVYNFFRGKFNYKMSSLLQFINLGLLPIVVIFFVGSILQYLVVLGITTLVVLFVINVTYISFIKLTYPELLSNIERLVKYGIQRMPGDVFLGLFLAIPVFIANNYFSIITGGNIAFCFTLFNIIIAVMSPINIILLPEASKIVYEKDVHRLKKISDKLLAFSIGIGVFTLVVIFFLGEYILQLFNIKEHAQTFDFLILIFTGVVGYSIFSVIRSIIDAYYVKAQATVIILAAFVFYFIFLFVIRELDMVTIKNTLIGFSLSVNLLGVLTYYSLKKTYNNI